MTLVKMTGNQHRVFQWLQSRTNFKREVKCSARKIALEFNFSDQYAMKILDQLEAINALFLLRRGTGQRANKYRVEVLKPSQIYVPKPKRVRVPTLPPGDAVSRTPSATDEQRINGVIYKITCNHPDALGKVYIGASTTPEQVSDRLKVYARTELVIGIALRRYRQKNFTIRIISRATTKEDLAAREMFFIAKYKANDPEYGFNVRAGGEGIVPLSILSRLRPKETTPPIRGVAFDEDSNHGHARATSRLTVLTRLTLTPRRDMRSPFNRFEKKKHNPETWNAQDVVCYYALLFRYIYGSLPMIVWRRDTAAAKNLLVTWGDGKSTKLYLQVVFGLVRRDWTIGSLMTFTHESFINMAIQTQEMEPAKVARAEDEYQDKYVMSS